MFEKSFKVYVSCITYNHSHFIKNAMDGFCMQQTDFPYVCGIIDDASTDGEPEIIRQYLEDFFDFGDDSLTRRDETDDYVRVFAQHKENKNCFFAVVFLKYNHYKIGKTKLQYLSHWRDIATYIALCEGDDYWISPYKLQRQADYLDTNPDCSMCFHANKKEYPNGEINVYRPKPCKSKYYPEDIIPVDASYMATNSMFYRSEYLLKEKKPDFFSVVQVGDLPLMLFLVSKGFFGYIDEVMSVYRVMAPGSWSERNSKVSISQLLNNLHKIIKMYKGYNVYTKRKYRRLIYKKISYNRRVMYKRLVRVSLCSLFKFTK